MCHQDVLWPFAGFVGLQVGTFWGAKAHPQLMDFWFRVCMMEDVAMEDLVVTVIGSEGMKRERV